MSDKEKIEQFLEEYKNICKKHGMIFTFDGQGYIGMYLEKVDDNADIEKEITYLKDKMKQVAI